jgi:predicted small metal-binding protein
MMKLACKDLSPETTCTFEVSAESAEETAKMMLAHARTDHAADIATMSDEDVVKAFSAKVHA